ncbi:MAG: hypothetical protein KJ659_04955 [Actinobacteria bacterium]|nr:hypothetical protein [Actinomycetota bacterium]MBU1608162.1 hypothetical protein [Actinomycetota bacterium]MBU2314890.1 hypothetical protein [Actinomycetota bacterium]MBU2384835.1 hypothetical protein [Actinomycetota bacterium]
MIALGTALAGLAVWAIIATVEVIARDGYGPIPVRSHHGFYASSLRA